MSLTFDSQQRQGFAVAVLALGLVACNHIGGGSGGGSNSSTTNLVLGDCDADGIADSEEIATQTQPDVNINGVPDDCEPLTRSGDPGSFLILPEFKGTSEIEGQSIVTVTNVLATPIDVKVSFVEEAGNEESFMVHLAGLDTYSGVVGGPLPTIFASSFDRGYVKVIAVDPVNHRPLAHDGLLGGVLIFEGAPGYSDVSVAHDAFSFQAIPADGVETDLDGDGNLDLNGLEYTPAPQQVFVPRFVGQRSPESAEGEILDARDFLSALIVIPMIAQGVETAGTSLINMEVFNDNAQPVGSALQQIEVGPWARMRLEELSQSFMADEIRLFSDHAPDEVAGIQGNRTLEAGWVRMEGVQYVQNEVEIPEPPLLVFLLASPGFSARFATPGNHGSGRNLNGSIRW